MNVLFLSTSPTLPQLIGGAQWSLHYFAEGMKKLGHQVSVISALRDTGWLGMRNKLARAVSGTTCPIDHAMEYPTARGWNLSKGLVTAINSFKPDVVIVIGIGSQPVPLALDVIEAGIPLVYMVMDVDFNGHGGALSDLQPCRFISNSEFTARRLAERFDRQSIVIRPPINQAKCKVTRPGDKVVMVNPQTSKGALISLALAQARPEIPFVFYEAWSGDISEIRKIASKLSNVEWRSPVMDPRKVYREARIILVPSQAEEAWGMVASEAQCSAIPVLGSDIGGLAESIGDGGIRIAPDATVDVWLHALDKLWNDTKEWVRLSAAAEKRSQRNEIQLDYQMYQLDNALRDTVDQFSLQIKHSV